MGELKSHLCPTCGGSLRIDNERQMYACPFCGMTFDYEYFREDDVIDLAEQSLKAKEFHSAEQAFDFMLTKEPMNRRALRGKLFVATEASSIADFQKASFFEKMDYGKALKAADGVIEACAPEDKEYFGKFKEMLEKGKEYKEFISEAKDDLSKERKDTERRIEAQDRKIVSRMPVVKGEGGQPEPYDPITGIWITAGIVFCVIVGLLLAGLSVDQGGQTALLMLGIFVALAGAGMIGYLLVKNRDVEDARSEHAELSRHLRELDGQISNRKQEAKDLWTEIFHLHRAICQVDKDRKSAED